MPKKSVRVNTGRGGRPNRAVRHSTSNVNDIIPEITHQEEISTEDEEIDFNIRETIKTALVENQIHLSKALSMVAESDPKAFLTSYKDYAEFILPKLQRTDSKIDPASPLQLNMESITSFKKRKEEENDKRSKGTQIPG